MTDTTQAPAKREKTSEREWLQPDGKDGTEETAIAGRYTVVLPGQARASIEFTPKTDDPTTRMLAIFGWLTRMGNDVNTWKHEKGERAATAIEVCQSTMDALQADPPVWADRSGGGLKIDKDVLAQAVVHCLPNIPGGIAAVRPKLDEAEFLRKVRSNTDITAAYAALKGKATASLDDVLATFG